MSFADLATFRFIVVFNVTVSAENEISNIIFLSYNVFILSSYLQILDQVQNNMATVVEQNKKIEEEEKQRIINKEKEKELLKAAQIKEKLLKDEKEKMDKELADLKKYRDKMAEMSGWE